MLIKNFMQYEQCLKRGVDKEIAKKALLNFHRFIVDNSIVKIQWKGVAWFGIIPKFNYREIFKKWTPILKDHEILLEDKDGKRYLIFQPYKYCDSPLNREKLDKWCILRGLNAEYYPTELSWHRPGETILIIIEVNDNECFSNYISRYIKKNKADGFVWYREEEPIVQI